MLSIASEQSDSSEANATLDLGSALFTDEQRKWLSEHWSQSTPGSSSSSTISEGNAGEQFVV